ncbi:MAG: 4-hydroxy-tetrahydrodipicolinate reductase [Hydrogenibacillus sp.]|nr:4-hydroxy-tetrahydrodipicolinate reductase [Hydrogenibacillus sp.]
MSGREPIAVVVAGAFGKMGRTVVEMIEQTPHFRLVGIVDPKGRKLEGVPTYPSAGAALSQGADVFVDFTTPEVVYGHARAAIDHGVRPVIGTTGLTPEEIADLSARAGTRRLGGVIAPNFALGAVLMMRMVALLARYFPYAEIIELHHENKRDAPSGTAIVTAAAIARARRSAGDSRAWEPVPAVSMTQEAESPSRGLVHDGVPIHSVRLPGLVAHQTVLFGGVGETLTLRHDTSARTAFMPGLRLAIEKAMTLDRLVVGLENVLD